MLAACKFEFLDNPAKVYYSGELLKGRVTLEITNAETVTGIYIRLTGTGYCNWTFGSGDNKQSYTGEENYLHEKRFFVGDDYGEVTIQPGVYNYDFQIQLPPELPTSIEGVFGYIRYVACVTIDHPVERDPYFETTFTVIKPLNLNDNPSYREPVVRKKQQTFYLCCFLLCFMSDPLVIKARLPVRGYTPGQTINLEFTADNRSDQDVLGFKVELVGIIEYTTSADGSHRREEEMVVTTKRTDGCYKTGRKMYQVNLDVSPVPPTDIITSNICKVQYYVKITGFIGGCHDDACVVLPIVIGTYPISDDSTVADAPSRPHTDNVVSQEQSALVESEQQTIIYPAHDPPSYEEVMRTDSNFRPKYPVYRRQTSYSSSN